MGSCMSKTQTSKSTSSTTSTSRKVSSFPRSEQKLGTSNVQKSNEKQSSIVNKHNGSTKGNQNQSVGRKLGGESVNQNDENALSAREAAAKAAEERLNKNKPTGKLAQKLQEERQKSYKKHLEDEAKESLANRQEKLIYND